ncbi:MAG TPA: FdrA family protein [candidate division Zixibacteria bacterium]|nr:FdrA family protein [candidate division Zixibacteria bacterium]HBZ00431.1 FdrA family protein [candidate division Zixibacteria bacterium]
MKNHYVKGTVRKGEYYDSVTLMRLAQKIGEISGVLDSAAVMASDSNKAILESAGMLTEELRDSSDNDLIIVLKAENQASVENIDIDKLLTSLKSASKSQAVRAPRSLDGALKNMPDANLAIISVAGRFAGDEARRALEAGLHVMLFSDNVSLETEIELKRYAVAKGLLLMGPDCGTAIINGVPLGFANAVRRGDIGIVAASGTGLQEVSCIISNNGAGISQAIGTGSRDLGSEVGGLMFIEGIKALSDDKATKIILLVSKPPALETLEKIAPILNNVTKPIVAIFLGAEQKDTDRIKYAKSLEGGALLAVTLSKGETDISTLQGDSQLSNIARAEIIKLKLGQQFIRGLFSGGTFSYEAQVLLRGMDDIYSNSPIKGNKQLDYYLKSQKHTLIDMGADEFTVGRLHPMIDFSLRKKRMIQEATDPETAIILFDIVLGFGANMNPLDEIAPAIEEARQVAEGRYLSFICSITGTDNDPQNRSTVMRGLKELEIIVTESNAAASKLARMIVEELAGRK